MTTTIDDPPTQDPELGNPNETVKSLIAASVAVPGSVLSGGLWDGGEGDLVGADEAVVRLLGVGDVARVLGVSTSAVSRLVERGRKGVPLPAADYVIGDVADEDATVVVGWLRDREEELRAWFADPVAWAAASEEARRPVRLLGYADIGALFGVAGGTVRSWRVDSTKTPNPVPSPGPDFLIGEGRPVPGWLPQREQDWRDWYAGRPGQGKRPTEGRLGRFLNSDL